MADNTVINTGAGGDTIATDDLAGVKHQRVKVEYGADGSATDVSGTTPLPAANRPPTSSVTQVASSATSVTLKASNANRLGLVIANDSTSTLYVKFGATASTTSYTIKLSPGALYETGETVYTGIVDGIWSSANGNAYVTELT